MVLCSTNYMLKNNFNIIVFQTIHVFTKIKYYLDQICQQIKFLPKPLWNQQQTHLIDHGIVDNALTL